jgi:acyl-CoA synthetase (AMP-forming)/AMP-acid ligase II
LKTISENSDDQTLHFSFKLDKPIAAQKTIHFRITKPLPDSGSSAKTLDSNVREYLIHYPAPAQPEIKEVQRDEPVKGKLTIKGTGFLDSPTYPLQVRLTKPDGSAIDAKVVSKRPGEIVIEMPSEPAGCWSGDISLGTSISAKQAKPNCFCFFIAPSPKIDSATIDGKIITVEGEDLIPTQFCDRPGPALTFQVSKGDKTAVFQVVGPVPFNGTEIILRLRPTAPAVDDTWIVKVLLDGKEIKEKGTTAIQKKK